MAEEIEITTSETEENSYISKEKVSQVIQGMIDTPDQIIRGFTTMEILNRVQQLGINIFQIISIHEMQTGSIVLQGINTEGNRQALLIHTEIFLDPSTSDLEKSWAIEEISYDEAAARQIESETKFTEGILELEVLYDGILAALDRNDTERWENIDGNDVITQGSFAGKTLVEAILIYRNKILTSSDELRSLGNIDENSPQELFIAKEKLLDANENYLLLIMGIGEKNEELVHIIPKTQEECNALIESIVQRKNPRELLDWMKNVHTQIDENNWQSGTVEKNYLFFTQTLNVQTLEKIRQDIFENEESLNYRSPYLLLEFAVLASGRPNWDIEGGVFNYDRVSPVDSRLWDPDIAEQALIYAMDLQTTNNDGEEKPSMVASMLQHMEMQDPLLEGKSPTQILEDTVHKIQTSVMVPTQDGGSITLGESPDFQEILTSLKLQSLITKKENGELGSSYNDLSLEEMVTISTLARLGQNMRTYRYTQGRNRVKEYTGETKVLTYEDFNTLFSDSIQDGVTHVGDELNRNFQETWNATQHRTLESNNSGEVSTTDEKINIEFAKKLGITHDSEEYKILTLYNDINGVGGFLEVSDNTREAAKTAGFMLAMVAGSVLIGGAAVAAIRVGAGIAVGLASEGAIMGMTGSALGYGLDASLGDARGFYTPSEAIIGVGSDFALGAATGAIGGPLVHKFGNPNAAFLSRTSIPNKVIFGADLTFLGLGPEFARISAVNQAWHGSEIWTQSENGNPFIGKVKEIQRGIFGYELNQEQIQAYFSTPPNWEVLPKNFESHRIFPQFFHGFGFKPQDISLENDKRFIKAFAIWKILNPGNSLNLWQSESIFIEVINEIRNNRSGGPEVWKEKILETTMKWIELQENRASEII